MSQPNIMNSNVGTVSIRSTYVIIQILETTSGSRISYYVSQIIEHISLHTIQTIFNTAIIIFLAIL